MAWAVNGTPNTLTSGGNTMTISDLSSLKFNIVISHTIPSGNTATYIYLNNDNSSGNYARRQSENYGSDGTGTSQNNVVYDTGGDAHDKLSITYIFGVSSAEKLAQGFGVNRKTAGSGTAPGVGLFSWKWANTSSTIDRVDDDTSAQSGTYAADSNLSALGTD